MSTVLEDVIHPDQACAVPGRKITDSLVLIRDVICYARDRNIRLVVLNLDFEKAFDRVSHQYLFQVLQKNGLSKEVYSLGGAAVQGPCQQNFSKWAFIQGGKKWCLSGMSFISSSVGGLHRATGTDLEKGQMNQRTGRSWDWRTDSYLCFIHGRCNPFSYGNFIYTKSNGLD